MKSKANSWTSEEASRHQRAAELLTAIMHRCFKLIGATPQITEGKVKDFILEQMALEGLFMGKPFETPIVAFGDHAAEPHYFPRPGSRRAKPGTLVMIDIWGRLRGRRMPYGDITWMGHVSKKVSPEIQLAFDAVIGARDACVSEIRKSLKEGRLISGKAADEVTRQYIRKAGYEKYIKHSTGHVLGFVSMHGQGGNLNPKNNKPLRKNLGYTIEPGIYINGKFGIRSEINFYVTSSGKMILTTTPQKELVII